jgi:hypothetical protein
MNNLNALRPITRRAVSLFYKSPGICEVRTPVSASAVSVETNIELIPVTRKAGPASLEASVDGDTVTLTWPFVSYVFAYVVYRATSPDGPFSLRTSDLREISYVDAGLLPGTYYYKVTGIEPDFGETLPTPLVTVTV